MEKKLVYIGLAAVIIVILFSALWVFINPLNFFEENTDDEKIEQVLQDSREQLLKKIKEFRMKKLIKHRDLILRKENFSQISKYQEYVTPNNATVQQYKNSNGINSMLDAYETSVDWTWVSDSTLHGRQEKWLYPEYFISITPNLPSNPVPGNIVSDCESQAYTLVSLIEATGTSKANIRVVVGEVNFSGEIGGHAWVQVYQNGEWFELEATSGPYWDEDDQKLVSNSGFSFDYFKNHDYPVVEYWAFFNDVHYYNPDNGKESAGLPAYWKNN